MTYLFKRFPELHFTLHLKKCLALLAIILLWVSSSYGSVILIPMDADSQKNHLKAYGITYWVLTKGQKVQCKGKG